MKSRLFFILIIIVVFSCHNKTTAGKDLKVANKVIETFEPVEINETKLWILIRTKNPCNPVFMYLHGGPGHSIIPWDHYATDSLLDKFTVVHYDQRGAGLSLDENIDISTFTMDQFIDDCHDVTMYLKKKFKKEKIYLLGHSWGTVLGIRMINKYPEHFAGYIGVGQIVNWRKQNEVSRKWVIEQIKKNGNDKNDLNTAKNSNFFGSFQTLLNKYRGGIHNVSWEDANTIRNKSPYKKEKYTNDLFSRGLSFSHSGGNLLQSYTEANFFREIPEIRIPVYFFCGRYDYLTSSPVVEEYYSFVKASVKNIFWFEKSAHRTDIEEPDLFQQRIIECFK